MDAHTPLSSWGILSSMVLYCYLGSGMRNIPKVG
jgi:hypothetical protein